ncbi:MAG TPA: NAD(P)H-hydrate dehydratase [Acidimicrobiales bacterium]|nr:NAD(P)H-hydrate dehydratase [Acidimicrobiales bacterium]
MIPILTAAQMRDADARAAAVRGGDVLVRAAGTAVAFEAKRLLGSCYGSRVGVLAGPGLNGADGRVAAEWLRARGARVDVIEVAHQPDVLRGYDLVIDAAFGLGCSRPYVAPRIAANVRVLAVDLPSGVNADTGQLLGEPPRADVTLAIGALKLAHVTGPAAVLAGDVRFAGIGIVEHAEDGQMEDDDLVGLEERGIDDHKWSHALQVLAGSTMMPGAAQLVVRGALAGGASMIRLASRADLTSLATVVPEVVHTRSPEIDSRCRAVVAGPGLGADAAEWLSERLSGLRVPVVMDADALDTVVLGRRDPAASWILTPHEGEFARLAGRSVGEDRVRDVRALARETGCVVLLKGPTTLVASPDGRLRVVRSGTPALATAGTGDVLAGLIGAFIARGHDVMSAGALAAHLHGRAGALLEPFEPASALAGAITTLLARRRDYAAR